MSFHVAHNMFKVIAMRTNDHVDMAGHDAISINFKAFILLAMFPAGNHYIFVFVSDEKVYPVYNRKTYKITLVLIMEFIFCAYCKLKVLQWNLSCKKVYELRNVAWPCSTVGYLSAGHEKQPRRPSPIIRAWGGLICNIL